ncbi:MAG: hypothetical protein Q7K54_04480 [Candidatus Parcubacteria bacterium]|nr:hypothetical protein [Candidatus Parcubacteria bacterium]
MKYYILNINYYNKSRVDYWLETRGLAPIFYGHSTLSQIGSGIDHNLRPQAYADARRFVETFKTINKDAVIFSIGDEYVYIYQQKGLLQEINEKEYENDSIKYFEIDLLKKIKIKYCPLVLTSIKANRYIQSGTFRDLNHERYLGNTRALEYLIHEKIITVPNYAEYLQCLSSLEFETLIAKYLEEKGLFVPAYKGGFLRNYDLFCRNTGKVDIILGETIIKPGASISVQIKLNFNKDQKNLLDRVDLLFCIKSDFEDKKVLDWRFLKAHITSDSVTNTWLKEDLNWVKIRDR